MWARIFFLKDTVVYSKYKYFFPVICWGSVVKIKAHKILVSNHDARLQALLSVRLRTLKLEKPSFISAYPLLGNTYFSRDRVALATTVE
jgi:hypothetical protein